MISLFPAKLPPCTKAASAKVQGCFADVVVGCSDHSLSKAEASAILDYF